MLYEDSINQTSLSSFIYLKDTSDYNQIVKDIYAYFDKQINLSIEDYQPDVDPTTMWLFYIYQKTNVLNENYILNPMVNPEMNPMIHNHNEDLLAASKL